MYPYLPHTEEDIKQMLEVIGVDSVAQLFSDIPANVRLSRALDFAEHKSELEVRRIFNDLAQMNVGADQLVNFLGAGAYDHYIPSVVGHLAGRSEFYTAYTPYQPEVSQGTLQVIFEYQTMICELTGLDASNASLYDGATACAEAAFMACSSTRKNNVVVSETVNPNTRKVLQTYLRFKGLNLIVVPENEGVTDITKLQEAVDQETAAVIIQSPNFFGIIEDVAKMEPIAHQYKGLLIMSTDPISLAILKSPGELGADIAVGEGQALGNSLSFGGPYLGFIAATKKLTRKLPGRIVGETNDVDGKRGFVLTLQAREQHIRRERATSNITSNQGLNALMAAIYLVTMGKQGLKEVAEQCVKKAHYAATEIAKSNHYSLAFNQPFFKEFAIKSSVAVDDMNAKLLKKGILGGYNLGNDYEQYQDTVLLCVTEKRTKTEIDQLVAEMEGI